MKLSDYASNVYSQTGEDGMIAEAFRRLGLVEGVRPICVEFGAGDGIQCSNTANLWKSNTDWQALLIEADAGEFQRLEGNVYGFQEHTAIFHQTVTAGGENCIDALMYTHGINFPDLMSIDVDGDDFFIFMAMKAKPRLTLVEYNRTVPPHIDLVPAGAGNQFGCGAYTMIRNAEMRGHTFIGLTESNLFFCRTEDAWKFVDIEKDLNVLLPPENFMYIASDFTGKIIPIGAKPPWGLTWPPSPTEFIPNQQELLEIVSADSLDRLIRFTEQSNLTLRAYNELAAAINRLIEQETPE